MFDINGSEFLVLGALALFVLGPERLPGYAAQAGRVLRQLRAMADGARDQVRDQLGPEFDDVDWKSLDPRQYDPRKIVRQALLDDDGPDATPAEKPKSAGGPTEQSAGGSGSTDGTGGAAGAAPDRYDDEAT